MLCVVRNDSLQLDKEKKDVAYCGHSLVQEVDRSDEPISFVSETHLAQIAKSAHFFASIEFLGLNQSPAREKRQKRGDGDYYKRQLIPTKEEAPWDSKGTNTKVRLGDCERSKHPTSLLL